MKQKSAEKQEYAVLSPFTLQNCASRLRGLCKRRNWVLELHPEDLTNAYHFRVTGRLHSAVSGYMCEQGESVVITLTPKRSWTLTIVLLLVVLLMIPLQVGIVEDIIHALNYIPLTTTTAAQASAEVLTAVYALVLLIELCVSGVFFHLFRRVYTGPQRMMSMLEKAFTDALTDLPLAYGISDEDGELVVIDELPSSVEQRSSR